MANHYKAVNVGVNSTVPIRGTTVGGFIAITAGTVQFTLVKESGANTVLTAIPVTPGMEIDIPFFAGTVQRSTCTTAGGASGILFYT
jgi:hypothetical protein